VVEDESMKIDRGMGLARIYLVGDVLDDVKLRNIATRLLNAQVLEHGAVAPRMIRLIWENTTAPSPLRRWTVLTTIMATNRKYFARNAARYPADFMTQVAAEALTRVSTVMHSKREAVFTQLLPGCLELEDESLESAAAT
jgi:hypothetical protein